MFKSSKPSESELLNADLNNCTKPACVSDILEPNRPPTDSFPFVWIQWIDKPQIRVLSLCAELCVFGHVALFQHSATATSD